MSGVEAVVSAHGEAQAAALLGISTVQLFRCLNGYRLRSGVRRLIERALPNIEISSRTLVIDTRIVDGSFNPGLGVIKHPVSGTDNGFMCEAFSAGAGSRNAVSGGAGGSYSKTNSATYSGSAIAITGLGVPVAGANAADAAIGAVCIARGGFGGDAGASAGLAANNILNGVGDVKHNGANADIAAGNTGGGGSAGNAGNGEGTPFYRGGPANGCYAPVAQQARLYGAGSGGTAGTSQPGTRGEARLHYTIASQPGFARLLGVASGRSVGDVTTLLISLPSSIDAERDAHEKILAVAGCDRSSGTANLSFAGWVQVESQHNHSGGQICFAAWEFDASAADPGALTIAISAAESLGFIVFRFANAGEISFTATDGNSTNANSPSHDAGAASNNLFISLAIWDANPSTITGFPAGYSNPITQPDRSAAGACLCASMRYAAQQVEDPGAYTSSTAPWIGVTLSIRPAV